MAAADRAPHRRDAEHRGLDHCSDIELVSRIRSSDVDAFDALYLRYRARLLDFAYRYLQSRDAAEDVVQETMLAVWRNRETWVVTAGVPAYLYASIRNRALNQSRHADTVRRIDASVTPGDLPGTEPQPDVDLLLEQRDTGDAIRKALTKLSDDQQRILLLRYRDEMTSEQIGVVLGISTVAAKKQVQRAVAVLSRILKPLL